ncbi:unnamed protein product [Lactuca saligna]|uniref:Uncharacterized protein n=1 Tax=Lactuca saligna TaxID=75948 RepID=A0AA35ZB28_LACSI|nr:unnamed protein product [Lactuca saligna]
MNAASKKLHHQQQKNLSSVLNSVTEGDAGLNLPEKEPIEKFSLISGSVDTDHSTIGIMSLTSDQTLWSLTNRRLKIQKNMFQSYIGSLNQFTSPTSVIAISLQITLLSCTSPALSSISTPETTPFSSSPITAEASVFHVDSVIHDEATTEDSDPVKLESLVKHVKESMFLVLHSVDIGPQYKKLLDALVKMVIEELFSLHEERNTVHLFSSRIKIVMLCILAISSGFFLFSDVWSSYEDPPPT